MNYLTRQELAAWLNQLAEEQTLVAPIDVAGNILYRPVKDTSEIAWDFTRSFMSVKETPGSTESRGDSSTRPRYERSVRSPP
jgi:hypothetical protein